MPIFGTTVNNLFSKSRKPKDIAAEAEGNDVKSTKDLKNGYQRRRLSSATTGIDNNQNSCSDDCGSTVSGHSLYNREAPLGCEQNGKIQESGLAQIAASQAKIAKTKSKVEKPKSKDPEGKDAKAKSKDAKEKSKHAKANAKDAKAKSPKAELKRSDTTCSILGDGELHKADSRFKVDKESSDSESKHFTGMPHLAHKRGREMTLRRKFTDGETGSSFTGSSCNRSSTSRDTSMEIIRMHGNDIDVVVNTAQPASRATSSIDSDQHDLSTKWSLWEMVQDGSTGVSTDAAYENACRHVKSFATIEQFMHLYNGMPDPSCVLKKQSIVRKPSEADFEKEEIEKCLSQEDKLKQAYKMFIDSEPEQISAMMIFRDGISPTWEDPANFGGGHFQFVFKSDFPVFAVDELWERTLFSILGNLVEGAEHITGIRLADKLSSGYVKSDRNNLAATAIRFEVWHSDQPTETINALRKSLHEMFTQPLKHGGSVSLGRFVKKGDRRTHIIVTYRGDLPSDQEMVMMDGHSTYGSTAFDVKSDPNVEREHLESGYEADKSPASTHISLSEVSTRLVSDLATMDDQDAHKLATSEIDDELVKRASPIANIASCSTSAGTMNFEATQTTINMSLEAHQMPVKQIPLSKATDVSKTARRMRTSARKSV